MLETCLTILNVAEKATKLFDWFTGLSFGKKKDNLSQNTSGIKRLSDKILYAPNLRQAINRENAAASTKNNAKEVYDLIHPVAEALNEDLLASAVVSTPDKLRKAFKKSPWEVLTEIRPASYTKKPANPDLVPIVFQDSGVQYIGWQMRGALPLLFNCDFEYNGSLYVPPAQIKSAKTNESPINNVVQPYKAEAIQLLQKFETISMDRFIGGVKTKDCWYWGKLSTYRNHFIYEGERNQKIMEKFVFNFHEIRSFSFSQELYKIFGEDTGLTFPRGIIMELSNSQVFVFTKVSSNPFGTTATQKMYGSLAMLSRLGQIELNLPPL